LLLAVEAGSVDVVRFLLGKGADPTGTPMTRSMITVAGRCVIHGDLGEREG
jgi:hypothetical protein